MGATLLGAELTVELTDGTRSGRRVHTDGSFASASDPRVLVGLGDRSSVERVEMRWPDGAVEEWTDVETGRYVALVQGEGTLVRRNP